MKTKFFLNQRVRIIDGFYRGRNGRVRAMEDARRYMVSVGWSLFRLLERWYLVDEEDR